MLAAAVPVVVMAPELARAMSSVLARVVVPVPVAPVVVLMAPLTLRWATAVMVAMSMVVAVAVVLPAVMASRLSSEVDLR